MMITEQNGKFLFYQASHMEIDKETLLQSVWPAHSEWQYPFFLTGGKKILHSDFQNILLGKLLAHAGHERNVQQPIGRSPAAATQVVRFEERGRTHWPIASLTRRRCRVCAEKGVTRNVSVICERCDVAFCCDRICFVDYHLQGRSLKHFILLNHIPLPKTVASAGNVRKRNLNLKNKFLGNRNLYTFRRIAVISVLVILPLTD